MENRIQRLFLTALFSLTAVCGWAEDSAKPSRSDQVIEPDLQRRELKVPKIDSMDFEVGAYYGVLSIQDFGSKPVKGVMLAYHVTEDIFLEANYGISKGDKTSFEKLSGGASLLSDSDREYKYYDLSVGWNVLPGEVFVTSKYAFNSALYLIGGIGGTDFAGDNAFTVNVGVGFRMLLTDWVAWHVDARDHLFDRSTFGKSERTNNLELRTGFSVFF
jgi:outer membrane beta-barrel protein